MMMVSKMMMLSAHLAMNMMDDDDGDGDDDDGDYDNDDNEGNDDDDEEDNDDDDDDDACLALGTTPTFRTYNLCAVAINRLLHCTALVEYF